MWECGVWGCGMCECQCVRVRTSVYVHLKQGTCKFTIKLVNPVLPVSVDLDVPGNVERVTSTIIIFTLLSIGTRHQDTAS